MVILKEPMYKICKFCHEPFPPLNREVYCSTDCWIKSKIPSCDNKLKDIQSSEGVDKMINLIKNLFLKNEENTVKQETENEKEISIKDLISAQMKYEENLQEIKRNNLNILSEMITEIAEIADILNLKHLELFNINRFSAILIKDEYIAFFQKQLKLDCIYFDRKIKIIENKDKVIEQNSTKNITSEDKEKTIKEFKQRILEHFKTLEVK